ncbi:hypothetical protein E1267_12750 [Nonomuraea longispora]|uniref:Uncharacterized protein n=1 Tax=Nonomuraea longispora TaxID=1848320 RepID=A0A4R4NF33_9ACTN|nr:hypothetical protein [Nonomuraea longispora]TDC07579.1 hypothetical protein E1267_12750 [Nonomuraea longispora]
MVAREAGPHLETAAGKRAGGELGVVGGGVGGHDGQPESQAVPVPGPVAREPPEGLEQGVDLVGGG